MWGNLTPCSSKEGPSLPNRALPVCYAGYASAKGGSPPTESPHTMLDSALGARDRHQGMLHQLLQG